eukprot:scaffold153846_cov27-Tisochrysis_lutea.AAC.1
MAAGDRCEGVAVGFERDEEGEECQKTCATSSTTTTTTTCTNSCDFSVGQRVRMAQELEGGNHMPQQVEGVVVKEMTVAQAEYRMLAKLLL